MASTTGAKKVASRNSSAGDHRGQAGARALADAGGRLDVGRVGRDARGAAGHRGDRVDDQDALRVGRDALLVVEAGLGADGGHRAHRVEEVGEQQREGEEQGGQHADGGEGAEEGELAEGAEVGHVDEAVELGHVERPVARAVLRDRPEVERPPAGRTPATAVARIEIRIAPRTRRTHRAMMRTTPMAKTSTGQPVRVPPLPSWTGTVVWKASGMRVTKPASTKPIRAMKRPMPTEIAIFSCWGTAWKTALRKPVSTRTRMMRPSSTIRPIASAQVDRVAMALATNALRPRPVASASGKLATVAHQDGQQPGHQRRAGRDHREVGPVAGAAAQERARGVRHEAEDQRVEDDDVGHRQEGDDAAAHLPPDGRSPLGDLEEPVEAVGLRRTRVQWRCHRSRDGSVAEPCYVRVSCPAARVA